MGSYSYRVVVTNGSAQSATSAPVSLTVTPAHSTLAVTSRDVLDVETVNLTTEGNLDWAHWGLNTSSDFDQKSGVTSQISNYSPVGTPAGYNQYSGNGVGFTWTDGTPDLTVTDTTTGLYVEGFGSGYQVQVPAAVTNRVLKMYVGAWEATAHFDASLSDGSAPFFFDESFTANGSQNRVYTLTYAAPLAGATPPNLIVRYWLIAGAVGNVTLNSASLSTPVTLTVERAASGQLKLMWPRGILLESASPRAPWTTNINTSPFIFTPNGPQKFFRVLVN